ALSAFALGVEEALRQRRPEGLDGNPHSSAPAGVRDLAAPAEGPSPFRTAAGGVRNAASVLFEACRPLSALPRAIANQLPREVVERLLRAVTGTAAGVADPPGPTAPDAEPGASPVPGPTGEEAPVPGAERPHLPP